MPARGGRAIGVVLVIEVAFVGQRLGAETVEPAGDVGEAGHVQRVGDQGAVPRPHIGIRVAGELHDVRVIGGDDRAAVVDLRAKDQQRSLEQLDDFGGQVAEIDVGPADPQPPVAAGAVDYALRAHFHQPLVQLEQFIARLARRSSPCKPSSRPRRSRWTCRETVESTEPCAIGLPCRCPSSASRQVPSAPWKPLVPVAYSSIAAEILRRVGPIVVEGEHQISLAAVVDDRAQLGIEVGGIADLRPEHVEILMVHHPHGAGVVGQVLQLDLANENIAMEIDRLVAVERPA